MPKTFRHCTVRIDPQQFEELRSIANQRSCRPSHVIRDALSAYLGGAAVLTHSQQRMARISEFSQVALDLIIREEYPQHRELILAETDKRLGQYHGA